MLYVVKVFPLTAAGSGWTWCRVWLFRRWQAAKLQSISPHNHIFACVSEQLKGKFPPHYELLFHHPACYQVTAVRAGLSICNLIFSLTSSVFSTRKTHKHTPLIQLDQTNSATHTHTHTLQTVLSARQSKMWSRAKQHVNIPEAESGSRYQTQTSAWWMK